MAKKEANDKAQGKGQDKMHVMSNPTTGEVRTITQADWRQNHKEYLAAGFIRPDEVEDVTDSE